VSTKKTPQTTSKRPHPAADSDALWRGFEDVAKRVRDPETRQVIRALASVLVDHEARLAAIEDEPREAK